MSDANLKPQYAERVEYELPMCFDDRQNTAFGNRDKYVFISYSHADKAVYEDLKTLYDAGLNFWYDKKLRAGDYWDETVKDKLRDERCVGALIFVSVNTVKSEAVEQELKLCERILQERGSSGKSFKIIPVTLSGGSILQIVRDAFVSCDGLSEKELSAVLPHERVKTLLATLSDKMLYIARKADGSHIAKLIDELKKYENDAGYKLFSSGESVLRQFNGLPGVENSEGRHSFAVGEYPQDICDDTPGYCKEGIYKINDKKIFVIRPERGYYLSPLKWQVLRIGGDKLYAVTEKVIDCCRADDIDTVIDKFRNVVFTDQSIVSDVRLVDINLINQYADVMNKWKPTDYAARTNAFNLFPLFWGIECERVIPFTWQSGVKIFGKLTKDSYAGIRLVAEFVTDKLIKYLERRI